MLPLEQKIFFYAVAGGIFLLILRLVRRRKLRENYTLLWLFISLMLVVIVYRYDVLVKVSTFLKAYPTSMLMFCGMIALLLLVLQLSTMNSLQATQIKNLAQRVAITEQKIKPTGLVKSKRQESKLY